MWKNVLIFVVQVLVMAVLNFVTMWLIYVIFKDSSSFDSGLVVWGSLGFAVCIVPFLNWVYKLK